MGKPPAKRFSLVLVSEPLSCVRPWVSSCFHHIHVCLMVPLRFSCALAQPCPALLSTVHVCACSSAAPALVMDGKRDFASPSSERKGSVMSAATEVLEPSSTPDVQSAFVEFMRYHGYNKTLQAFLAESASRPPQNPFMEGTVCGIFGYRGGNGSNPAESRGFRVESLL